MFLVNGKKVMYQGKEYIVVHKYETGYCELKTLEYFQFILVHESEITFLD